MQRIILMAVCSHLIQSSHSLNFLGSPLMKTETGQDVSLVWNLSTSFSTYPDGSTLEIQSEFYSPGAANLISYTKIGEGGFCQNFGDSRLSCVVEGNRVGFTVTGVRETDASRYSCLVAPLGFNASVDNEGLLYIYKKPTSPSITGMTSTLVDQYINLSCNSRSLSLPVELHNLSRIEYSWTSDLSSGNLNPRGNTVTIGPVEHGDNGATVTCTTRDQGSSLSVSSRVVLNVMYPPGRANLEVSSELVVESKHNLTLTCSLEPGQDGNPPSNNFTWRNTDTGFSPPFTGRILTIEKNDINANLHDGTWTCTPHNNIGTGVAGQIHITVNAAPVPLTTTKSHTVSVEEILNMTCSFKAKPAASVTWQHRNTSPLPHPLSVTSHSYTDNRYTVTVSTISWLPGSGPVDRCMVSGEYRCSAHNSVVGTGEMLPISKHLETLCSPYLINRTDDKAANLGKNHTFEAYYIAKPKPVNVIKWSFVSKDMVQLTPMPPNIIMSEKPTSHRFIFITQIHIHMISELNYGTYILEIDHSSNDEDLLKFILNPEGPPLKPSNLKEIYITAVSLRFSWTAGFNGGFPQTFTVLYRAEGQSDELSADVDPLMTDIRTGDILDYKLKNPDHITPDTIYYIRIRAQNGYNGDNVVYGDSKVFETKKSPALLAEPLVEFTSSHAAISLRVSSVESVSHIITYVCVDKKKTSCNKLNSTLIKPDMTLFVLLPETPSHKLFISLIMYDGDDVVNTETIIQDNGTKGTSIGVIVGSSIGAVVLTAIVVNIIVLWRRQLLCNAGQDENHRPTQNIVVYENVNPRVIQQPTEEVGINQYEGLDDTFIPVVEPSVYDGLQPPSEERQSAGRMQAHHGTQPVYQNVL